MKNRREGVRRGSRTRRPTRPSLVLIGFLLLAGAAGCATVGREFPSSRVHEIRNGATTKAELLAQFGRPYRRGIEDGDSTWTYVHYRIKLFGGQTETKDLYLRFDGDTVRSYTYNADIP